MRLLQLALIAVAIALCISIPTASAQEVPPEEFNGPFASWRQVQCAGEDDTASLQNELNTLGRGGSPVLYVAPGTCRITDSLRLEHVQYVTLIGHDPGDTSIVYAGPPGKPMLALNGVGHSRFGRLTWDGGGLAGSVYYDAWTSPTSYFPTALRHEDEVFQNLGPGGVAGFLGAAGGGSAETTWIRDRFIGPADAGLFLANYNVLDQWVWDSVFDRTARGVTNDIQGRVNGSGGFAANRSAFFNNSEADLETSNVAGPYGDRWNYSRGSVLHVFGRAIGSPAPGWTSQGNAVLDSAARPILLGSVGPLGLLDNTFRGGLAEGMLAVEEGYSGTPTGDLWAIGNTFSNSSRYQYSVPAGGGRFRGYLDDTTGQTISDPGYASPPAPPRTSRAVFEPAMPDGAGIQAAINSAAGCGQPRCVVHLPYGSYPVSRTVTVPAGSDLQIVGDGLGATILQGSNVTGPVIALEGPGHAVVRDIHISAQGAQEGLAVRDANQSGGLIHAEDVLATGRSIGLQVDGVSQTTVDLIDFQAGGESSTPGATAVQLLRGSQVRVFNGALGADTLYDVRDNSALAAETIYEEAISQRPVSVLAPGGSGSLTLDSGKLHSYAPGAFDASTFSGLLTLDNIGSSGIAFKAGANFLGLGIVSDSGVLDDSSGPFGWWMNRVSDKKGGTRPATEQQSGVADPAQFLRDHLMALRAAKPIQLGSVPPGVTDVRLYRVSIDTAKVALHITQ